MQRIQQAGELWFEWAPKLESRQGLMLSMSALPRVLVDRDPGYSSVYLFDKAAADDIKATKSSRNFKQYPVYSQQLIVDLDGGDEHLERAELKLAGFQYDVFSSGGKGYHLVFPTDTLFGPDVPEAHKQLVDSWGIDADLSLYRHSSIVSLPGRIHPKTRKRKSLVKTVDGALLQVPDPKPVSDIKFNILDDIPDFAGVMMRVANLSSSEPRMGGRHTALWSLAGALFESGLSETAVEELLIKVNEQWKAPKDESEVRRAVQQASRR